MALPVQDNQGTQTTNNAPDNGQQKVIPTSTADTATQITQTSNTPPAEDIITRASQVTLENQGQPQATGEPDILNDSGFDRNKWNATLEAATPEQRAQLESAYKSLQTGANKKFQSAAEMKRQAEALQQQPWTQERIAQVSQDPQFVQAANAYAQAQGLQQNPQQSGLSNDEWSALSESDKQQFHQMAQNQKVIQTQLTQMQLAQEDERLTGRYKNYDATQVMQLRKDLVQGKVQATGEHLWKALDYDNAVNRAYKLGKQDRVLDLNGQTDALSMPTGGVNVTTADPVPVKQENESHQDLWRRIAQRNMAKLKQAQATVQR